jgi:protein-S-isoprenylcysteine O-methyltransferase Ste14
MATRKKGGAVNPIARLAFLVLSTGFYFALAILGEGGLRPFFSQPALVALAVITSLVVLAAYFAGGNISSGVREDRGNRWVLAGFSIIGLLSAFVPACTDRIGFWTIDGDTTRWLGVALYALGSILRIWPVYMLGHRFSGLVAIQSGHTLLTTGIYRVIRHPSYLGMIILSLGWALAFRSITGVLIVVTLIPLLIARIRAEEALLLDQFGPEYEDFRRQTPSRLIPGLY